MTSPDPLVCSAKGCTSAATWRLLWNNPKLHTPDRRKTWLACDEHREHLSKFLDMRGFLKEVADLEEWQRREDADNGTDGGAGSGSGS